MTQQNVIVLRIRRDQAEEFERGFAEHEVPLWREYHAAGKFLSASLTRVEYGTAEAEREPDGIQVYLVLAHVPGMAEHSAHDADPRFEKWLELARRFQPEPPLVFGGERLEQIGDAG
jgi:hypothetical protein